MLVHEYPAECFNAPVFRSGQDIVSRYPTNFTDSARESLRSILALGERATWCVPDYITMTRDLGFKDSQTKMTTSIESHGNCMVRISSTVVNPFGDSYYVSLLHKPWVTDSIIRGTVTHKRHQSVDGTVLKLQTAIANTCSQCLDAVDNRRTINVIHASKEYDADGMVCLLPRFVEDQNGEMESAFTGNRKHLPGSVHRRTFGWQDITYHADTVTIGDTTMTNLEASQLLSWIEQANFDDDIELHPTAENQHRILGLDIGRVLI